MPSDSELPESEKEREAARRGIALIDAGKWKQRDTTIHFPRSWVREIVERFAVGELSLLNLAPPKCKRSSSKKRGDSWPPSETNYQGKTSTRATICGKSYGHFWH